MPDLSHHSTLHGIAYENYLQKQNDLECIVLEYLFDYADEPVDLQRLSTRYRSDSCLISLVLAKLRYGKYIGLDYARERYYHLERRA
jgi:hypothetical protein